MSGKDITTVYANEVQSLIFKHKLKNWENDDSFPSLRAGCFPLVTISKNVIIPLGKEQDTFTVRTTLYPCELAPVLTGHKMQGQTVDSIILGNLSPKHKYGKTGWIYVVLSRVTSISGLHLLTRLECNPKKYKPREEIKEEMKRLHSIEQETMARIDRHLPLGF